MNQAFSKIWIIVVAMIIITGGIFAWQYFGTPKEEVAEIGPDAVWLITNTDAIPELQKCSSDLGTFQFSSDCVVPIMEKYGASKKAIEFFEKSNYWFMIGFQEKGRVDLVEIDTPWRVNDNEQYALVNGSPSIVNIESEASDFSPQNLINYSLLDDNFPKYTLWPGDNSFVKQEGESFFFQFSLKDERGCHVCYSGYWAVVSFDFKDGNYTGARLLDFCTDEDAKDERFLMCNQFDETANWKTYKNEEYGFEIKYPDNFSANVWKPHFWPSTITVVSTNEDPIKKGCPDFPAGIQGATESKIRINNIDYLLYAGSEGAAGSSYNSYCYVTERGQKYYVIDFVIRTTNGCGGSCGPYCGTQYELECINFNFEKDIKEPVQKIISTFRFLE